MQINLFVCTAEHNRVNKTDFISNRFVMDGTIKQSTSGLNVIIEVEKSNPFNYGYNYMYINEFDRWYYIDDIVNKSNNRWTIYASVDVLMSFKNDILSSSAIIDKSEIETDANMYLDDGSFVMDTRKYNQIIEFPSGLNENGSYILICAGGV